MLSLAHWINRLPALRPAAWAPSAAERVATIASVYPNARRLSHTALAAAAAEVATDGASKAGAAIRTVIGGLADETEPPMYPTVPG